MTTDPADFLADRLAEDEARVVRLLEFMKLVPRLQPVSATDAVEISWSADADGADLLLQLRPGGVEVCFREDPRRLEHDLRARALIAADHFITADGNCATCATASDGRMTPAAYPCPTLLRLTWAYAEHAEFADVWFEE